MAVFGNAVGNRTALDDGGGDCGADFQVGQLGEDNFLIGHFQNGISTAGKVIASVGGNAGNGHFAFAAALASDADVVIDPSGLHIEAAQGALRQFGEHCRGFGTEMALVLVAGQQELDGALRPADGLQGLHGPDGDHDAALHIQAAQAVGVALGIYTEVGGSVKLVFIPGFCVFDIGAVHRIVVSAEHDWCAGTVLAPVGFQNAAVDGAHIVLHHPQPHILKEGNQLVCHLHGGLPIPGLTGGVYKILPHGEHFAAMGFDIVLNLFEQICHSYFLSCLCRRVPAEGEVSGGEAAVFQRGKEPMGKRPMGFCQSFD